MPVHTIATVNAPGDLLPAPNAGAPFGMNFAYHHVIPKERLRDFWNAAANNDDLKSANFASFITALIDATYDRLYPSSSRANVPTALQDANGRAITRKQMHNLFKSVSAQKDLTNDEHARWNNEVIARMYQWAPGNLHKGPQSRINPTEFGHEPDYDDGGNDFETSANLVLPEETFKTLSEINAAMTSYLNVNASESERSEAVKKIGSRWPSIYKRTEVWPYDARQWYSVSGYPGGLKWRLKAL